VPKVPSVREKLKMKAERNAGIMRGRVILRRIRQRLAPNSSADSSRLESRETSAPDKRRKAKA